MNPKCNPVNGEPPNCYSCYLESAIMMVKQEVVRSPAAVVDRHRLVTRAPRYRESLPHSPSTPCSSTCGPQEVTSTSWNSRGTTRAQVERRTTRLGSRPLQVKYTGLG